jgi:hypothetical protein
VYGPNEALEGSALPLILASDPRRDDMHRAALRTEGRIVRVDLILLDILLSKSSLESGIDEA